MSTSTSQGEMVDKVGCQPPRARPERLTKSESKSGVKALTSHLGHTLPKMLHNRTRSKQEATQRAPPSGSHADSLDSVHSTLSLLCEATQTLSTLPTPNPMLEQFISKSASSSEHMQLRILLKLQLGVISISAQNAPTSNSEHFQMTLGTSSFGSALGKSAHDWIPHARHPRHARHVTHD